MRVLLLLALLGCDRSAPAPQGPPMPPGDWSKVPLAEGAVASAAASTDVPPAFRNGEGKVACPVMGMSIATPDDAVSYADYKGKRYYFCCDSCEKLFVEDPEAYADGSYLRDHGLDPGAAACAEGSEGAATGSEAGTK